MALSTAVTMRRRVKDLPALLRTPVGRAQLRFRLWHYSWPLLMVFAGMYRRTLIRKTRIIVVVGSFGKSTTTRAVLTALNRPVHPRFTYNAWSSVARAVFRIRPHDRQAVLEVGIGAPGQMAVYARTLRPDVTVVTSIGSEHNRSLKTLEMTRAEKSRMVQALPPSGVAILNGDDPHVVWMKGRTSARVVTFGFQTTNDIHASDLILDWPNGTRFTLHVDGQQRPMHIRLMGKHMVYPILAAVAASRTEGFALDEVIPPLEKMEPTRSRMEPLRLASGAWIIRDELKSSLETFDAALEVFSQIPAQRRIVVLGEVAEPVGRQDPIYRELGRRIANMASRLIVVGSSRTWRSVAGGAKQGGLAQVETIHAEQNVLHAVERLRDVGPGDVVLIKGRDTQRLARVSLALMGRPVRCDISRCHAPVECHDCPMLERGWNGARVVT